MIISYKIRNSLYINVTSACSAECVFCPRKKNPVVKGHNLKLERDPSSDEIIESIKSSTGFDDVVFCGFGEPTMRLSEIIKVAKWLKEKNIYTRLNTNGHGNLINKRSIASELAGLIDEISVSLNVCDENTYVRLVKPSWGKKTFNEVIKFIEECKPFIPKIIVTAVDLPDFDRLAFKEFVKQKLGLPCRIRAYNRLGD